MREHRRRLLVVTLLSAAFLLHVPFIDRDASTWAQAPMSVEAREAAYRDLANEVSALERQARSVRKVVELVAPTVVHIDTTKSDRTSARFGGSGMVEEAGSGVVIEFKGKYYILTNRHVIRGASESNISIRLADGREIHPQEKWSDAETDIAVMAIDAEDLVPARLGDSRDIQIGDFVLAVGSPFGLQNSVTFGIISAKGRRDLELGDDEVRFQDFIQTDAAINPGNSGGPLVNARGEVVGVNAFIFSGGTGGSIGLGFAIPIDRAKRVLQDIVETGEIRRPWVGLHLGPAPSSGASQPEGAEVVRVDPRSPAAAAGVRVGDLLVATGGRALRSPIEWEGRLLDLPSDATLSVTVERDGERRDVALRPEDDPLHRARRIDTPFDADLVVVDPTLASYLGLGTTYGLLLTDVQPDSGFRRLGLADGDVLLTVNGQRLEGADDVPGLVRTLQSGRRAVLDAESGGRTVQIVTG